MEILIVNLERDMNQTLLGLWRTETVKRMAHNYRHSLILFFVLFLKMALSLDVTSLRNPGNTTFETSHICVNDVCLPRSYNLWSKAKEKTEVFIRFTGNPVKLQEVNDITRYWYIFDQFTLSLWIMMSPLLYLWLDNWPWT